MLMQPLPFVKKNISLSLFQEISLTSNLNCSSARGRWVFASMKVTTSSLFPTAMVWPSGLQHMLMFSPTSYSISENQRFYKKQKPLFASYSLQWNSFICCTFHGLLGAQLVGVRAKTMVGVRNQHTAKVENTRKVFSICIHCVHLQCTGPCQPPHKTDLQEMIKLMYIKYTYIDKYI